jgi:hypothetical protein
MCFCFIYVYIDNEMSSLPLNKHTLSVQFTSIYIYVFARASDHHHLPIFFIFIVLTTITLNTLSSSTHTFFRLHFIFDLSGIHLNEESFTFSRFLFFLLSIINNSDKYCIYDHSYKCVDRLNSSMMLNFDS